ncbi:unnamed protein product [Linum tenue]|uniref:Uncharacterized protein n=1 Tax=Linum tenue TaxID=586396 RepID=A0AAV0MTZ6_9ROSI|nr:unnamed protein product [Linum tenue]
MRFWISTMVARGFMVATTGPAYWTARKTTGKQIELGRTSKTTSPWRMPNLWRAEAVDLTRGKRSWAPFFRLGLDSTESCFIVVVDEDSDDISGGPATSFTCDAASECTVGARRHRRKKISEQFQWLEEVASLSAIVPVSVPSPTRRSASAHKSNATKRDDDDESCCLWISFSPHCNIVELRVESDIEIQVRLSAAFASETDNCMIGLVLADWAYVLAIVLAVLALPLAAKRLELVNEKMKDEVFAKVLKHLLYPSILQQWY